MTPPEITMLPPEPNPEPTPKYLIYPRNLAQYP